MYKFIVVGGGTSGHINPAITIADALKEFYKDRGGCEIIFTGRNEGLEGELVPKAGYTLKNVTAKPFPMKPSVKLLKALQALNTGKKQCKKLIEEFKPDAVIGTGGYVCAPLLLEAEKLGVPVILHEANAFPGRANKLLGNKADLVLTGFESIGASFPKAKKIVYTGNPIRSVMKNVDRAASREKLGLKEGDKLVFAMGGSLGAKTLNDFILKIASDEKYKDVRFVLGAGKQQGKEFAPENVPSNLTIKSYIDDPQTYLSGADICITRAGAVTCAEVAAVGACSVMVPYPFAAHDHQTFNAKAFSDIGGAILVPDAEVNEKLGGVIDDLLNNPSKCDSMRSNAVKLAVYDCDERITEAIDEVLRSR